MKRTFVFNNRRMPFVTSQEPNEVWLGYAFQDFGGYRFYYVQSKSKPGTYFGWTKFNPGMDRQPVQYTWIGEFTDAASLDAILAKHDIDPPQCGKIIEDAAEELKWDLPED
jgi:hypothetical protein